MAEMVSRRLQQQLLSPSTHQAGGSTLCWAMREAILGLCRDNVLYGGQIEIDGIICITGPHDGQQLVVKVHEMLDNEKVGKQTQQEKNGNADQDNNRRHTPDDNNQKSPRGKDLDPRTQDNRNNNKQAPTTKTDKTPDQDCSEALQDSTNDSTGIFMERSEKESGNKDEDIFGPSVSDQLSEQLDAAKGSEVEALDLRLDSPASRIKQEPMDYEESVRFHPYSSSVYRSGMSQDARTPMTNNTNSSFLMTGERVSQHSAVERGTSSTQGSSPQTRPQTPLLVPFPGPTHHHDMSEPGFSGIGASPFMDSRLRHLLSKMPYNKPHPAIPFFPRRPLFPTLSTFHSNAPECKACGFTFAQVELLKEHNEAVHAVFTCSVCYRTFTSRSNLDRHTRLHTGHKPYICVKCGKAFSRKDHLTNHSAKHAFKCGKCLKRFVERQALQSHYDQDHQVALTNICEHCNKGFSDQAVYAEHLKSHPEYLGGVKIHPKHKPFACPECNYVCADKLQLLKHNQIHGESGKNLRYTCMSCGETFTDPLGYSQHFDSHQDQTDIFECCICRKVCHSWHELKQHEQNHLHHSSRGPTLACPVCYIIFDNEEVLSEHIEQHDSIPLGTFSCNVCNEAFSSLEILQKHEQEEKHYVKKSFTSPPRSFISPRPGSPDESCASPRPASTDPALFSSVVDSESNDSDEELDVIAVDESPTSTEEGKDDHDNKEPFDKNFVITDNPTAVIEVTRSESNGDLKPSITESFNSRSSPNLIPSSHASLPLSSAVVAPSIPAPILTAPVFPERSPHHIPSGLASPLLPGPLAPIMATQSPQPSPDLIPTSAAPWLPHPFHNQNNAAYAFPSPVAEYSCAMCSAKLLSFHDYETHCFSDHFRYPCMYCSKTFAQKANRDRHVCIHTGEKPYSCPECDQKFARGDKLKIHRMKWHNIQFPSTYSRPKENTSPGLESSGRRKDNSEWNNRENVTLPWLEHENSEDQEEREMPKTLVETNTDMHGPGEPTIASTE